MHALILKGGVEAIYSENYAVKSLLDSLLKEKNSSHKDKLKEIPARFNIYSVLYDVYFAFFSAARNCMPCLR